MPVKLGRKRLPSGYSCHDFKYAGRPAKDQGDFGADVGIADMACVNQFGEHNNAKHYHGGVVQSKDGRWWVYLEWGRIKPGKSWSNYFNGQDFQFVQCGSEREARAFFAKQMNSKNTKRLVKKSIGGRDIWAGKSGKDGYIVQKLATRERGLPDAYSIKDASGVKIKAEPKKPEAKKPDAPKKPKKTFQPQVVDLARSLVVGTQQYARAASEATGVIPTMEAIREVREELLPLALKEIGRIGDDIDKQIRDSKLIDLSKLVAALVPRPIPRHGTAKQRAMATILSGENVLMIQQDLDAFESALNNEDFKVEKNDKQQYIDPDELMGAKLTWIDPRSDLGKFVEGAYRKMTNNRHGYLRGKLRVKNMFIVDRPKQDQLFIDAATVVAKRRKGDFKHYARLQPARRPDFGGFSDVAAQANVFMGIHGTRAVNVHPIIKSNLRLPRQLKGVHISGAAFGHGIYFATDWKKSYGYTGHGRAYYGGGGGISGRGFFMFLNDVVMGKGYMTKSTGSWVEAPRGHDSVAAYPEFSSVVNDEHIIFNPHHQRIRYIIEGDLG
ncbi:MAG: hypothetical protein AAFV53_16185 [Myxococcota bacterium]